MIKTFADAMAHLMALEERFGNVHAALVVDDAGGLLDATALTLSWHTIDHATTHGILGARRHGGHVLLFTVGRGDIRLLDYEDVEEFERLKDRCYRAEVHLSDWLVAGGCWYRSMQLATMPPDQRIDPALDWELDPEWDY